MTTDQAIDLDHPDAPLTDHPRPGAYSIEAVTDAHTVVLTDLDGCPNVDRRYSAISIVPEAIELTWTRWRATGDSRYDSTTYYRSDGNSDDYRLSMVHVIGSRAKKDGTGSANHSDTTFRIDQTRGSDSEHVPAWIYELADRHAPHNERTGRLGCGRVS